MSHGVLQVAADQVREFRDTLADAGFELGNASGELRRGRCWVRTGYVMGEYYVVVWLKDERGGVVEQGSAHLVRWRYNVPVGAGVELALVLAGWSDQPGEPWPPVGFPGEHTHE